MNRLKTFVSLLAVAAWVAGTTCVQADEETAIGRIVSVKQSGWATRSNDTVKKTVKEGDAVYAGDVLDVRQGNHIDIALDAKSENILHLVGPAVAQINMDGSPSLQLTQGKAYALLDNLGEMRNFAIQTPTAVSSVRGTYFSVATDGTQTSTSLFQGLVRMAGRQANGFVTSSAVMLEAPQKSVVTGYGQKPSEPAQLSKQEFEEINAVIQKIGQGKKPLNYDEIVKGVQEAAQSESESSSSNAQTTTQSGQVLF